MRLRNSTCPAAPAPCSWNTCFAMSKPIVVACSMDVSFGGSSTPSPWHTGCRRGASTPSPFMHHASGNPNLGVVVGRDVLHQKVHQPPPLLKCSEKPNDFSFGLGAGCRDRHGLGRLGFGVLGLGSLARADEKYHEQSKSKS